MYKNPCLDSSVFLGGLNDEIKNFVKRGVIFRFLIERARAKEIKIHLATAAIAEVYRSRSWGSAEGECLEAFMALLDEDLMVPIELDRSTAIEAHALCRSNSKLRPFDSIHLACALSGKCDYLLTWDKGLLSVKHDKIEIDKPQIYKTGLFMESELASSEEQEEWNAANPKRADPNDIMFSYGGGI